MIRIEGLTIVFESFKIEDLHIQIDEEEFHFLLGPTGSGKTLILESIMGLRKPRQGRSGSATGRFRTCPRSRGKSLMSHRISLSFPHLTVKREHPLWDQSKKPRS